MYGGGQAGLAKARLVAEKKRSKELWKPDEEFPDDREEDLFWVEIAQTTALDNTNTQRRTLTAEGPADSIDGAPAGNRFPTQIYHNAI